MRALVTGPIRLFASYALTIEPMKEETGGWGRIHRSEAVEGVEGGFLIQSAWSYSNALPFTWLPTNGQSFIDLSHMTLVYSGVNQSSGFPGRAALVE